MQCADLDRYLEAFLDGRLGRARSGLLRRHLVGCAACRDRYEELREFERDLNRRMRAMAPVQSVWAGLELDLVRSVPATLPHMESRPRLPPAPPAALPVIAPSRTQPPQPARPPARSTKHSRLLGVLLLAAAVGTIIQLGRGGAPTGEGGRDLLAQLDVLKPLQKDGIGQKDEMVSGDPVLVREWLARSLGAEPALPSTAEATLVGARIEHEGSGTVAIAQYRLGDGLAFLYIRPTGTADPSHGMRSLEDKVADLRGAAWANDGFAYAVASSLPAALVAELRALAHPDGQL